jgi:ADP-ribose pyrophosphatase YjhB (NUDIX family)
MDRPPSSHVSVDVITLRYNPESREVEIATGPRPREPYLGRLALPGVLLWEGERLADAARRAVKEKLGFDNVLALGQLEVFDEPTRDPRGFTLSIAMWAVADGEAEWFPIREIPELAFDHASIVEHCTPMLADKLWRDINFTKALTGESFPVSTAVALTKSLSGVAPDRGNLNRRLAAIKGLGISHKRVVLGRGRPGTLWAWGAPPAPKNGKNGNAGADD